MAIVAAPFCCQAEDIQSYSIPKGHPPITSAPAQSAPGFEVNSAPIHWTTPPAWKQLPATGIRLGNFLVPGADDKSAEVAITSFPGAVGTELENVNRWRREVGLPAVAEDGIASQPIKVGARDGKLYNFTGSAAATIVASVQQGEAMWFFKLRGDKTVVEGAKPDFEKFLQTIQFGETASSGPPPADPHGGVLPTAENPADNGNEPKWNPPANWAVNQAGPMVVKSFTVKTQDGGKATVAISQFPGDVGGVFANVNRWRTQMGLAPIEQSALPKAIQSVRVEGGSATVVDLSNPDGQTGAPGRMIAAIVPHNDSTWFYKLVGDAAVVGREKAGFLKFVQTVHYP